MSVYLFYYDDVLHNTRVDGTYDDDIRIRLTNNGMDITIYAINGTPCHYDVLIYTSGYYVDIYDENTKTSMHKGSPHDNDKAIIDDIIRNYKCLEDKQEHYLLLLCRNILKIITDDNTHYERPRLFASTNVKSVMK